MFNKKLKLQLLSILAATILAGSAAATVWAQEETEVQEETSVTAEETEEEAPANGQAPEIPGLTYESTMDLSFAECFDVYYYNDGYKLLDVHDSARYLVVPEGKDAPDGLDEDIRVLSSATGYHLHGSYLSNGSFRCHWQRRFHQIIRS